MKTRFWWALGTGIGCVLLVYGLAGNWEAMKQVPIMTIVRIIISIIVCLPILYGFFYVIEQQRGD